MSEDQHLEEYKPIDPDTEKGQFYLELQNLLHLYRRLRFPDNVNDPITIEEKVFFKQMNDFIETRGPKDDTDNA